MMVAGAAVQKYTQSLAKEQELLMRIADMAIQTYVAESTVLRTQKLADSRGEDAVKIKLDAMKALVYEAAELIGVAARDAVMGMAEGDEMKMMLMGVKRFTKVAPFNVKECRRIVAQAAVDKNEYPF